MASPSPYVLAVDDFTKAVLHTPENEIQKNLDNLLAKIDLVEKQPAEALPPRLAADVPYALKFLKEVKEGDKQGNRPFLGANDADKLAKLIAKTEKIGAASGGRRRRRNRKTAKKAGRRRRTAKRV